MNPRIGILLSLSLCVCVCVCVYDKNLTNEHNNKLKKLKSLVQYEKTSTHFRENIKKIAQY